MREERVYGSVKRVRRGSPQEGKMSCSSIRLYLCLFISIMAIVAKVAFPQVIDKSGEKILNVLGADSDFESAMACLGETVSGEMEMSQGFSQAVSYILGTHGDTYGTYSVFSWESGQKADV